MNDLKNSKFGRLKVIKRNGSVNNRALWTCICDCGNTVDVLGYNLTRGGTKSCGCLKLESSSKNGKKNKTHGETNTRLFRRWGGIKQRCYQKSSISYKNYGGRGITMCEDWRNNFLAFKEWAINNGYKDELTIERIDNNGNYEPSNCTWATVKEQSVNRRTSSSFESMVSVASLIGSGKTNTEIAEIVGVSRRTVDRWIKGTMSVDKFKKAIETAEKYKRINR